MPFGFAPLGVLLDPFFRLSRPRRSGRPAPSDGCGRYEWSVVKSGWLRPTYSLAMRISAAVPPAIADPYVAIGFRPLSHIRPDVAALPDGIGVHSLFGMRGADIALGSASHIGTMPLPCARSLMSRTACNVIAWHATCGIACRAHGAAEPMLPTAAGRRIDHAGTFYAELFTGPPVADDSVTLSKTSVTVQDGICLGRLQQCEAHACSWLRCVAVRSTDGVVRVHLHVCLRVSAFAMLGIRCTRAPTCVRARRGIAALVSGRGLHWQGR